MYVLTFNCIIKFLQLKMIFSFRKFKLKGEDPISIPQIFCYINKRYFHSLFTKNLRIFIKKNVCWCEEGVQFDVFFKSC